MSPELTNACTASRIKKRGSCRGFVEGGMRGCLIVILWTFCDTRGALQRGRRGVGFVWLAYQLRRAEELSDG
jgi:hypothetical protein